MTALQIFPVHGEVAARCADGGGYRFMRRPQTYTARRLRREMSLPEVLLWNALRANQVGLRFRRQHAIGTYIVDFYCAAARMVIEVEGIVHDMDNNPERDARRFKAMEEKGYSILRIAGYEVLKDAVAVADAVVRAAIPLRQSLRACHLPMNGED